MTQLQEGKERGVDGGKGKRKEKGGEEGGEREKGRGTMKANYLTHPITCIITSYLLGWRFFTLRNKKFSKTVINHLLTFRKAIICAKEYELMPF